MTAFLLWLFGLAPVVLGGDENARAAACVAVAYAVAATPDSTPAPTPPPKPGPAPKPECCSDCKGTGFVTHGDGHKTPCPCPPTCKCKSGR